MTREGTPFACALPSRSTGNEHCSDNALMESTTGLFKTELIKPRHPWKTLSQVELATAEWIDWYCHRRLHGEIGHIPPVEYETNYYLATAEPQVTTTI
ncbi:integrase core domain-containing protein [Streptomyces sp. NPDC006285]|uniref:integrase core domain-containing protein n=1 Tax=Streptomyces sp. NPDC006285 TaxID=3364742 RepID=UPI00369E8361